MRVASKDRDASLSPGTQWRRRSWHLQGEAPQGAPKSQEDGHIPPRLHITGKAAELLCWGVGTGFWLPCFEKTADILGALPVPERNLGEAFDVHHLT